MAKSYLEQRLKDIEDEIKSKSKNELLEMVLKDKKDILIIEKLKEMENCFNLFIKCRNREDDIKEFYTSVSSLETSINELKGLYYGN